MIHIVKLAVGIEDIDHLMNVQKERLATARKINGGQAKLKHRTRHGPKRTDELLISGSIYWVIKGCISARQRLIGFETIRDNEGKKFCDMLLDPVIMPTTPRRHRAFQGWRYLLSDDAPPDQLKRLGEEDFPTSLAEELRELGLL